MLTSAYMHTHAYTKSTSNPVSCERMCALSTWVLLRETERFFFVRLGVVQFIHAVSRSTQKLDKFTPPQTAKAVKNEVELTGMRWVIVQ